MADDISLIALMRAPLRRFHELSAISAAITPLPYITLAFSLRYYATL
jgi:hypothetical protein